MDEQFPALGIVLQILQPDRTTLRQAVTRGRDQSLWVLPEQPAVVGYRYLFRDWATTESAILRDLALV